MKHRKNRRSILLVIAAAAWVLSPAYGFFASNDSNEDPAACPSGHSTARLTGWMLNNKRPIGSASYDAKAQRLEVIVESVGLPDGSQLIVFAGDDRIGQTDGLKDGSAKAVLTRELEDGEMVAVWDDDRPVVSGSLACSEAQPMQTPTPSPAATPTAMPTVTPIPPSTPAPAPSASPTAAPPATPTVTPMPSPTL